MQFKETDEFVTLTLRADSASVEVARQLLEADDGLWVLVEMSGTVAHHYLPVEVVRVGSLPDAVPL